MQSTSKKSRSSRVETTSMKLSGIRDARELLSDRRTSIPVTDYIKSLKEQIQNSEKNARNMFKELQSAKRDLLEYLQGAELEDKDHGRKGERHDGRQRVCRRSEERTRGRSRDERRDRGRTRDETRRSSQDKKRSRDHRRTSPERESKSRKSSPSPERGSEDPSDWKVIPPSEVDVSFERLAHRFVELFSLLVQSISVLLLHYKVEDRNCHVCSASNCGIST